MADLRPAAAAWRNSERRVRRTIPGTIGLYREAFAPFGTAPRKYAAAADGFHTGTKSVPTFAHDIAGLKGSLQCLISDILMKGQMICPPILKVPYSQLIYQFLFQGVNCSLGAGKASIFLSIAMPHIHAA